jgi:predicted DNA-binding protein (MmcQ/YjbR family)
MKRKLEPKEDEQTMITNFVKGEHGNPICPLWEHFGVQPMEAFICGYIFNSVGLDAHTLDKKKSIWQTVKSKVFTCMANKKSSLSAKIKSSIIEVYDLTTKNLLPKKFLNDTAKWNSVLNKAGIAKKSLTITTWAVIIVCLQ